MTKYVIIVERDDDADDEAVRASYGEAFDRLTAIQRRTLRIWQLQRELQLGWDEAGIDGSFDIVYPKA